MSDEINEAEAYIREHVKIAILPVLEPGKDKSSEKRRNKLVDDKRMNVWLQVFTDTTLANRNSYEQLETIGDKVIGFQFMKYAIEWKPDLTPDQLTNLLSYYASNKLQAKILKKFEYTGPDEELTTFFDQGTGCFYMDESSGATVTDGIIADLFEAIIGGIVQAGNSIENGLGDLYSYRWYRYMMKVGGDLTKLSEKHFAKADDEYVKTMFSGFDFYMDKKNIYGPKGVKIETSDPIRASGKTITKIQAKATLPSGVVKFLNSLSDDLYPPEYKNKLEGSSIILAESEGKTKEDAVSKVAQAALSTLRKEYGITPENLLKMKSELDVKTLLEDKVTSAPYKKISKYMTKNGMQRMEIKNLPKHKIEGNTVALQITAYSMDLEKSVVLFTKIYKDEGSVYQMRKQILVDYAMTL